MNGATLTYDMSATLRHLRRTENGTNRQLRAAVVDYLNVGRIAALRERQSGPPGEAPSGGATRVCRSWRSGSHCGLLPECAALHPLRDEGWGKVVGTLILGVAPRLPFDDRYHEFVSVVSVDGARIVP